MPLKTNRGVTTVRVKLAESRKSCCETRRVSANHRCYLRNGAVSTQRDEILMKIDVAQARVGGRTGNDRFAREFYGIRVVGSVSI